MKGKKNRILTMFLLLAFILGYRTKRVDENRSTAR